MGVGGWWIAPNKPVWSTYSSFTLKKTQPKLLERAGASPSLIARSSHLCPTVWGFWWEHHRKGNVFLIRGFHWRRKREKARDTDWDREQQTDRQTEARLLPPLLVLGQNFGCDEFSFCSYSPCPLLGQWQLRLNQCFLETLVLLIKCRAIPL